MRRSDRLFQIVNFLQGRRLAVTGREIADEFGVSVRTVYRDIQDLMLSGVPIIGEAGVGYLLDKRYHLPPLQFSAEEVEILLLGAAMVSSWTDPETAKVARRAFDRIRGALSDTGRESLADAALFAPESRAMQPLKVSFTTVRRAVRARQKLRLTYRRELEDGGIAETARVVRPLALAFFGPVWVLCAWCELRNDFRNFRLDRIADLAPTGDTFTPAPGQTLRDHLGALAFRDGLRG